MELDRLKTYCDVYSRTLVLVYNCQKEALGVSTRACVLQISNGLDGEKATGTSRKLLVDVLYIASEWFIFEASPYLYPVWGKPPLNNNFALGSDQLG